MIHQLGGKGSTAVLPSTQPDTFPEAFRKGRRRRREGKREEGGGGARGRGGGGGGGEGGGGGGGEDKVTKKEKEKEVRKEVDPAGSFPEAFRIGSLQGPVHISADQCYAFTVKIHV